MYKTTPMQRKVAAQELLEVINTTVKLFYVLFSKNYDTNGNSVYQFKLFALNENNVMIDISSITGKMMNSGMSKTGKYIKTQDNITTFNDLFWFSFCVWNDLELGKNLTFQVMD